MSRHLDVVHLSGDEYDRLMDEREILRQECERAWKEVDAIQRERDDHLRWRQELADKLDELEKHRDALKADAERYRWLRGDSCPDHSSRWTQWEVRCWKAPSWTGDLRRADLDDAIDAARGKE